MSEQKHNQRELLYSPKNWAFLAFLLSPILPAIFFYRNSKLLSTSQKGKKVLIGAIIFVIAFLVSATVFSYYASLIILIEGIIAVIIAKKLAKTQLSAYEEMKKTKGIKGGRNEAPLILLFLAIWITIGFLIPYAINKYVEKKYITTTFGGETVYLPRNTKSENEPVLDEEKYSNFEKPSDSTKDEVDAQIIIPATHKLHSNSKYNYSLVHPKNTVLYGSEDSGELSETSAEYQVSVYTDKPPYLEPIFMIRALDPARLVSSPYHEGTIKTYQLPLKEFVDLLVDKNIKAGGEQSVMPPIQAKLNRSNAYELWALGGSWLNEYFGYTLSRDHAFYYAEHNGIKFEVHFPIGSEVSEDILASFKWTS